MAKVAIIGAAGRMGRLLVSNVLEHPGMSLAGALEHPACPFIGKDAAEVAGHPAAGVAITASLEEALKDADAIIDFSVGGDTVAIASAAAAKGCAIVIGTTALSADAIRKIHEMADNGARIILASNYSIGVNLLFYLSEIAAKVLDGFDIEIVEGHHNQKKDAPSGTVVTLAQTVCNAKGWNYDEVIRHGREGITGARTDHEIGMHAVRGGDIVGDHTLMFCGIGERFELTHKASSRNTFAKGAVRAVAFLETAKPGFYDMRDVLGLK